MSATSDYLQHKRKLFGSGVSIILPDHRLLQAHTHDIAVGGLQLIAPSNVPVPVDCLVRFSVPMIPKGHHTVVAHARSVSSILEGNEGGFLVEMKFTAIAAEAVALIRRFVED